MAIDDGGGEELDACPYYLNGPGHPCNCGQCPGAQRDALVKALGDLVDALDPINLGINECRALDAAVVALGAAERAK